MSDNKRIPIQDRGWSEMHALLDRELPQEKKRRRLLPWFVFGGSAFAILLVVALFFHHQNKDKTNINANAESTLKDDLSSMDIVQNIPNEADLGKSKYHDIDNGSLELKSNSERKDQKTTTTNTLKIEEGKKNDLAINPVLENKNKTIDNLNEFSSSVDHSALSQSQFIGITNEENEGNLDLEGKSVIPVKSEVDLLLLEAGSLDNRENMAGLLLEPVNALSGVIPFVTQQEELWKFQNDKKVEVVANKKSLLPYLFAAANYQSGISRSGYGFGVGLEHQLNDFGVYIEAGYSNASFNSGEIANDFGPNGSIEEIEDTEVFDNGLEVTPEGFALNVNNFSTILSEISEVNFNIGVRKAISSNVHFDLGVAYTKLLNARNKSLAFNFELQNEFNQYNTINVNSSELYNTGAYSTYDIVPHIGLEYKLLRNVCFNLNYNYGLKNLIANTDLERLNSLAVNESIYRRNIEAKLRYQF